MENKDKFENYMKAFLEENSKVNLISKNDEKFLWEKHICDSLSVSKFFEKYEIPETLLDIGTGGGFPAVPVALCYPQIKVTAVDSIAKKIRAISSIKEKLQIKNLTPVCTRVETLTGQYAAVTSRAVSTLKNICGYALPRLKKGGHFIAYKSQKTPEEIKDAKNILKKYKSEIIDIIEYELPMENSPLRNLIIIKKT